MKELRNLLATLQPLVELLASPAALAAIGKDLQKMSENANSAYPKTTKDLLNESLEELNDLSSWVPFKKSDVSRRLLAKAKLALYHDNFGEVEKYLEKALSAITDAIEFESNDED